ncbi:peptidoglycan DD-metalloendopeptidase family protein [Tropicibacter alexandrii]|uniref:peptidoglycan DD-metalloendopeptidase family protein n=1 Tax=Tropicibacter alexandrii TaxID=2267683 RepID=UPI000EF4FAB2|nr:peptidoglycan DD-metalloendopeptidase family protein [Tropicibacter alexandrii]
MTLSPRLIPAMGMALTLAACGSTMDFDMRGRMGGQVDTSEAAIKATIDRPSPDNRGVISYPNYQVAVAKRGDTLADLATRLGLDPAELGRYNGIKPEDPLRTGELVALPRRVAEPSPATGAAQTGPIRPASQVDVATLAGNALDRAAPTPAAQGKTGAGVEPIRHKVARGETAFTIARTYSISPRALAEWNGLDSAFTLREGQFLLIPPADPTAVAAAAPVAQPGNGSPTPPPPSAAQPLPVDETPAPAAVETAALPKADAPAAKPAAPVADIGQDKAKNTDAPMLMPVSGSIIREYAKGRNEGIDISAAAGTPVKAAASGQVASISTTAEGVKFLLIRHPGDLITVYTHVDDISVAKGDAVSRGQTIARVRSSTPSFLHFEVRKGFESTDPMPYIQ